MGRNRALGLLLLLPLTGCVFAVGADDEGTEKLRDRVRELERRLDRLEAPPSQVLVLPRGGITIQGTTGTIETEPPKDPK
jgi:hypothetical protein